MRLDHTRASAANAARAASRRRAKSVRPSSLRQLRRCVAFWARKEIRLSGPPYEVRMSKRGESGARSEAKPNEVRENQVFPPSLERGPHPFPFRTRKLSSSALMVLHWRRCGRVGRCQNLFRARSVFLIGLSFLGLYGPAVGGILPCCQSSAYYIYASG